MLDSDHFERLNRILDGIFLSLTLVAYFQPILGVYFSSYPRWYIFYPILGGIFFSPSLVVYFSAFPGSPQKLYSGKTKTKTKNT